MLDLGHHEYSIYQQPCAEVRHVESYSHLNPYALDIHALYALVDNLEKYSELLSQSDCPDLEQLKEVRKAVVQFLQLGMMHASEEVKCEINADIVELFDEMEIIFDCYGSVLVPQGLESVDCDQMIQVKSFIKRVKRICHNIARVVRKHKKEILIGTVAAAGFGYVVYEIYESSKEVSLPCSNSEPEFEVESNHEVIEQSTPQEVAPALVGPSEVIYQPEELSFIRKLKEDALHAGSKLAHEIWQGIGSIGSVVTDPGCIPLPDSFKNLPIPCARERGVNEVWNEDVVASGHQKIDELFATNYSILFGERRPSKYLQLEIPVPSLGLLKQTKEVAKVAQVVRREAFCAKELSLRGKQVEPAIPIDNRMQTAAGNFFKSEKVVLDPIFVRSDGVWEITSNNIKKFNFSEALDRNKINHIFNNPEHNLHRLGLNPAETYEKITRAIVKIDKNGSLFPNAPFKAIVDINGCNVEVRGVIVDGELKYGTFFVLE